MSKITFDRTKPIFGPHMDKIENYETSIFKDVYDHAAKNIGEIIDSHTLDRKEHNNVYYNYPECNNIVALVGERGSGKTSALHSIISFLNAKEYFHKMDNIQETSSLKHWKQLHKASFFCLPVIDPTKMSDNETLIGSISARIYHEFLEWRNKNDDPYDLYNRTLSERRELLQYLKDVNQAALHYASDKFPEANEDMLSQMEKVENLKAIFGKMIECFLELEYPDFPGKKYFVISIDDLDMNVACSYKILEEIRKFLMLPNVIILISTSMTQLKKDVTKQFVQSLKLDKMPFDDGKDVLWNATELAQQYLYKLLPSKRRCNLPTLNSKSGDVTYIEFGYAKTGGGIIRKDTILPINELPTVVHLVLHLIYRKTTLILMEDENNYHPIIPTTLRTLQQFLYFLDDLEDIPYSGDDIFKNTDDPSNWYGHFENKSTSDKLQANLNKLSDYILKNCLDINREHMSEESMKIAAALRRAIHNASECSIRRLNANIVRELILAIPEQQRSMYFGVAQLSFLTCEMNQQPKDQAASLLEATYLPETVSMGDVMFTLGKIHKKSANQEVRNLIVLLRTMWSIRAAECFFGNSLKQMINDKKVYDVEDDFRALIGGFMINPDGISFFYNTPSAHDDWHLLDEKVVKSKPASVWSSFAVSVIGNHAADFSKWRQQFYGGNIYYKTQYNKSEQYEDHVFLCNVFAVFTNLLTAQKTIERFSGQNKEIPEELKNWLKKYYMIFPFCSMEYIDTFYNTFRAQNNQWNQPYTQKSLQEKVKTLWQAINNSVDGNNGINVKISSYIDAKKAQYICDAIRTCPFNNDSGDPALISEQLLLLLQDNDTLGDQQNKEEK